MSQRVIDTIDVPPEVLAFAREQQVEQYLPVVLETAKRVFPNDRLSLALDEDPEVEDLKHIVLITEGAGLGVGEFLAANDEYHLSLFASIPAALICTFRLSVRG